MEGATAKGLRHVLVDDCGDPTMMLSTKLATKLATKKNPPANPEAPDAERFPKRHRETPILRIS
jgi:hypothetical protein